jgi:hypothetical protein
MTTLTQPLLDVRGALYFLEGQFAFQCKDERGAETLKFVSPEAVQQAFAELPVDSGWLGSGIVRWGHGRSGEFAVMLVPAGIHRLTLTGEKEGRAGSSGAATVAVPFPPLVFAGCGRRYWVWALKNETTADTSPVFHAPLPNVDFSGGICYGSNLPPAASLTTIHLAWHLFIRTPFNMDHAGGKARSYRQDVRELLRELAGRKARRFPRRELEPCSAGRTMTLAHMIARCVLDEGW